MSGALAGSAASREFFTDAFGAAFGLGSLGIEAAPESQRPRRYRLGKISRNIDPPPARQDDVARDQAQIPFLAAVSLDHILGADRNRRGKRLDSRSIGRPITLSYVQSKVINLSRPVTASV